MTKTSITKASIRRLAKAQGYYLAGPAQAAKTGLFASVPVWGFDADRGCVVLCTFIASRDHPSGYCPYPPVSGNIFASGGIKANQLGLDLNWKEPKR